MLLKRVDPNRPLSEQIAAARNRRKHGVHDAAHVLAGFIPGRSKKRIVGARLKQWIAEATPEEVAEALLDFGDKSHNPSAALRAIKASGRAYGGL